MSDEAKGAGVAPERVDAFVRLLGQHQQRVYLYVLTLLPKRSDAEEVMQEANLVLWREFEKFQAGTNFLAWACKVAFHQVLAWRKRKQRDRLEFSDAFLDAVSREAGDAAERLEERAEALSQCMENLQAPHREMLRLRYGESYSIEALAGKVGRPVDAAYRALSRIRQALHECVRQTLARRSHA